MAEIIHDSDEIDDADLSFIVLDSLKKGKFIQVARPVLEDNKDTIHYDIKHIKELTKEIYRLYSQNATPEEFVKVFIDKRKKCDDDIHNFINRVENIPKEEILEVVEKKEKGNEVIIKFKKVSTEKKKALVKAIVKRLLKKVTSKQLEELFEQAILKLNDMKKLEKANTLLKKKKPKIKGSRGCYKLMIDDIDLFIIG